MEMRFCPQCGIKLPEAFKFCSGCGHNLTDAMGAANAVAKRSPQLAPITLRNVALVGLVSVVVLVAGWQLKTHLAGPRPTVSFEEMRARQAPVQNDATLVKLRETAESAGNDKQAWKALAEALLGKLQESDKPPPQQIFETIDALRKVLDLDPEDPFALISMADISLNQQVFEKAVDYYSKYLAIAPNDHLARARYASALAFVGRPDEGIVELKKVLADEPNNFHALAYLAVTHAQQGDKKQALEIGETALTHAPSEEARSRFEEFMQAVRSDSIGQSPVVAAEGASAPEASMNRVTSGSRGLEDLEIFVRGNQIAGPKFVRAEQVDGIVAIYFKEFPMEKMPPFIRDKFTQGVVDNVKTSVPGTSSVVFLDSESGVELHRAEVPR